MFYLYMYSIYSRYIVVKGYEKSWVNKKAPLHSLCNRAFENSFRHGLRRATSLIEGGFFRSGQFSGPHLKAPSQRELASRSDD